MAKRNVGTMGCGCCGREVVVKANDNDTLSYTCLWCDNGQYWRKGTEAHRMTLAKIKPLANDEPAANDAPPPVTKTAPAKASAGTLLG